MRIEISNIGKIEHAEVILDGITIVAGENNTGKSTIGKSLFSLLRGMDEWEDNYYIQCSNKLYEKVKKESEKLEEFCLKNTEASRRRTNRSNELIRTLCNNKEFIAEVEDFQISYSEEGSDLQSEELLKVRHDIEEFYKDYVSLYQRNHVDKIISVNKDFFDVWKTQMINILKNEVEIDEVILQARKLRDSFNQCFKNQFKSLSNDNEQCIVSFSDSSNESIFSISKNKEELTKPIRTNYGVYFIESPKLFDEIGRFGSILDPKDSLKELMVPNSVINIFGGYRRYRPFNSLNGFETNFSNDTEEISEEANEVLEMLRKEMNGQAEYYVKEGIKFKDKDWSVPIFAQNVSTGLKAMAFLEYAIRVGAIQKKDILILDEPEINLHPEWQVIYARALVLLQKTYNLTLLITSHSPYFIRAIECFTDKYEVMDNLNVYLVEKPNKNRGKIWNVMESEYGMSELYERLSAPFDSLQDEINQKYND